MSLTQRFKDGMKTTAYSAVTLVSLLGAGCTQNYHNYGNIPEKYSARKGIKPVQRQEPVIERIAKEEPKYSPAVKVPEKPTPKTDTLEQKLNDEINLPKGLVPGEGFSAKYNQELQCYEINGEFVYAGLKVGEYDSDNRRTLLFGDGKIHNIKGPYISVGERVVIGASKGTESPSVEFLRENGLIDVEQGDFVVMQSNGSGDIVVMRTEDGKIPRVVTCGDYTLFNGNQVLKFKDEYKQRAKGPLAKPNKNQVHVDLNHVGSSPMHVITLDQNRGRVGSWDVIVDNYNQMKSVSESSIHPGVIRLSNGDVTSLDTSFHNLSPEEQRALRQKEQTEETIQAPAPQQSYQESRDISWKDSVEPSQSQPKELPEFSSDNSSARFKGETYRRVNGSNKFVSPSGRYFLVN